MMPEGILVCKVVVNHFWSDLLVELYRIRELKEDNKKIGSNLCKFLPSSISEISLIRNNYNPFITHVDKKY